MGFFDADTHIDECDDTWSYLPEDHAWLAPRTIEFTPDQIPSYLPAGYHRLWYIDGRLAPRRHRSDERTGTTVETRELTDVRARLAHMDALGVDVQVIYPTLFLHEPSRREDLLALYHRSYNRWLADRCAETGGRLRWVAMVPYASPQAALEEIEFAAENGAAGIYKLGIECGGRNAADPMFDGAYRAAASRGLALCLHQGTAWTPVNKFLSPYTQSRSGEAPVYEAFAALARKRLDGGLPEGLRVGFIEAGAGWVPHALSALGVASDQPLATLDFYVTCETFENVPQIIAALGEDEHLMIGTDYTHGDRSSVMAAHPMLAARDDLDQKSALRITSDNARRFYNVE